MFVFDYFTVKLCMLDFIMAFDDALRNIFLRLELKIARKNSLCPFMIFCASLLMDVVILLIFYFQVKKLGIKHINIMEWFEMRMEKILLLKSAQNPDIYHRNERLLI